MQPVAVLRQCGHHSTKRPHGSGGESQEVVFPVSEPVVLDGGTTMECGHRKSVGFWN